MNNPFSSLFTDIFVDNLEKILEKYPIFMNVVYWYRYVDDIFVVFKGTERQIIIFLDFLNSLHPNIENASEVEENNFINFLDLTITNEDNKLVFDIFHKPIHTYITINNKSTHLYSHKFAAFYAYIHRLISIPLSLENFQKELNLIRQIAVNNDYNLSIVDNIL